MGRKKAADDEPTVSFEQSLEDLEQIVAKLEGGKLGLAESLAAYELGVKRLNGCYHMLTAAERRIALVQKVNEDGCAAAAPFADEETADLAEKSAARSRRRTSRMDEGGGLF